MRDATAGRIVKNTCKVSCLLENGYLGCPKDFQEWFAIAENFESK